MNWTSVPYETQQDDQILYMNNGLASYYLIKSWEWWYWWNTDWFGVKTEDWRLLSSEYIIIVRYKCCENVVVFLAFRYVVFALALALGIVALLTSLN